MEGGAERLLIYMGFLWSDGNVPELSSSDSWATFIPLNYTLRGLNFTVCELYLNLKK